jgi:hypothetical protein
MLAGNPSVRTFANDSPSKAISYLCAGNQTGPETNAFPAGNCPDYLRASILMPSCWNGKDVAPVGGKGHVSYFTGDVRGGSCPPDFPIRLPQMLYEIEYDTNQYKDEWVDGKQPFHWANGDSTGYSFHADFTNGWDMDVLTAAVNTCTTGGTVEECSPLTVITNWDESRACKKATSVKEDVKGPMGKLPGCNAITGLGETPRAPEGCADTATLLASPSTISAPTASVSVKQQSFTTSTR